MEKSKNPEGSRQVGTYGASPVKDRKHANGTLGYFRIYTMDFLCKNLFFYVHNYIHKVSHYISNGASKNPRRTPTSRGLRDRQKSKILNLLIGSTAIYIVVTLTCCGATDSYEVSRQQMVEAQIKARGIKDPKVLAAMLKVPRHEFVPKKWRVLSYADRPLPIGKNQTISQPYIVALMTELLALKGTEKVLEIGTGSGYQAAILAEIVPEVYSIEIIPDLARLSRQRLELLGYKNISIKCGDGYYGWPEEAPFDGIIVTCGAPHVPPALVEQLKEGGRMVIPVGKGYQKLLLVKKGKGGKITTKFVADVVFVPLLGPPRKPK